jgi:putative intracellular protease/amidase
MTVYTYVFDGFADWETGHILPELRRNGVVTSTVGKTLDPVTSMGGFKIIPDTTLNEIDFAKIQLLILPGGNQWQTSDTDKQVAEVVHTLRNRNVPIAGICGATVFLAQLELLNNVRHTSNALQYLQHYSPSYLGAAHYSEALAVTDQGIVTASGLGSLEFTLEILKLLKVYSKNEEAMTWYEIFKHGVVPPE